MRIGAQLRTFVSAKLHDITVTAAVARYIGSVTIDKNIMRQADIQPYEQVHICNLSNGKRWVTYAIPGDSGVFELNGPGARNGIVGDRCVIMTYRTEEIYSGCTSVFLDENNHVTRTLSYPLADDLDYHTGL